MAKPARIVTVILVLVLAACTQGVASPGTAAQAEGALAGAQLAGAPITPAGPATGEVTPSPDATGSAGNLAASSPALPVFSHVFVIVLENKEVSQVAGSGQAPFLNHLATQYGRAANYYGVRHPSLPNYLALTGGDTFGVASDCTDCYVNADNIASQLEVAGRSWKAYMESMPKPCFTRSGAGDYAQKHNPFIYYDNIRNDPQRCNKIVPLAQLEADLSANAVPDYAWITPNLCNDMHDCPIKTGDDWLATWVPRILASPAWQDKGVLFVVFDEGTTNVGCCQYAAGGKTDTLVISPLVRPGFVSNEPYDHYSLLRTIEQAWGLPLLGKADCACSAPMTDFFSSP